MNSTLFTSGVFEKNHNGLWFYKEKEALDYILKINEKILTKNLNMETKLKKKKLKKEDKQKNGGLLISTSTNSNTQTNHSNENHIVINQDYDCDYENVINNSKSKPKKK